jgi:hypothetical protein
VLWGDGAIDRDGKVVVDQHRTPNDTSDDTSALTGVVYVPCAVNMAAGALDATATIAAEGKVTLGLSGARLAPAARSGAVLVSGGDIQVSGDNVQMLGSLFSGGGIKLSGARQTLYCGAVARTVQVSGADFSAGEGGPCAPR